MFRNKGSEAIHIRDAEDISTLIAWQVSMTLMQSYTTFTDESSAAADVLQRFKSWFWSVCSKFTSQEKQVRLVSCVRALHYGAGSLTCSVHSDPRF